MEDGLVSLGLVVGLDYANPYISPFREFQRLKHHPFFAKLLEGGECLAYGGRALNEGGLQSIPKLAFPGGGLIGDSAGFLNVPKIKGTHTSMKSGMVAAEEAYKAIAAQQDAAGASIGEVDSEAEASEEEAPEIEIEPLHMDSYQTEMEKSWVWKELHEVRNLRPSFHSPLGMYGGIAYSGLDSLILKGRVPWTFHHPGEDWAQTKPASQFKPIDYPPPDGKLSFDILTSVARTGTNHGENQPCHLVVKDGDHKRHVEEEFGQYAGLLSKVCPAGVYEYQDVAESGGQEDALGHRFQINS
jgi:electron-transferring-flavoprotein dehydrogenase